MPSVKAELTVKLDAGTLVTGLLSDLTGIGDGLGALDLAVDADQVAAGADLGAGLDLSAIESSLTDLVAGVQSSLGDLPAVEQVLEPIQAGIEIAGELGSADFQARVEALITEVTAILEGEREGGLIASLVRAFELVAQAPEGQVILSLLSGLSADLPDSVRTSIGRLSDLLPALQSLLDAFAGLMALESVLCESEVLTARMAAQLDPAAITARVTALGEQIEAADLATRAAGVVALDAAGLEAFTVAVETAADGLSDLSAAIASGMAFGESTLVYLDMEAVSAEVVTAATLLETGGLAPVRRLMEFAAGALEPLQQIDVGAGPAQSLDDLLTRLESQREGIVSQIDGLDPVELVAPVGDGLSAITEVFDRIQEGLGQITLAVQTATDGVVEVVEAVPVEPLAQAIETVVAPVAEALDAVTGLVGDVGGAIETTAGEAQALLAELESRLDDFIASVRTLFGEARTFIEGLGIDSVLGGVAESIQAFADLIAQAQMKPVFDGAVVTIETTADVVEALPLNLLPASVKEELDTVAKPVRDTDVRRVEVDLKALLGLRDDGSFELRTELENAVAEIQATYDELVAVLESLDPRAHLQALDAKLTELKGEIEAISPQLGLEPVQEAIDTVQAAVEGFDLDQLLRPVGEAFDAVGDAIREYSPAQLLEPIEARLTGLRETVRTTLRLETWKQAIADLRARATDLLEPLDPEPIEPRILEALGEIRTLADATPKIPVTGWLGTMVASLAGVEGVRIYPWTFPPVATWLGTVDGAAHLEGRSARIHGNVAATLEAVRSVDLNALAARLQTRTEAVRTAVSASISADDGPAAARLSLAAARLDVAVALAGFENNRQRYLASLEQAALISGALSSDGLSQVGETIRSLRDAFEPLTPTVDFLRLLMVRLGLEGIEDGVAGILRHVFSIASPERLSGLFLPILAALYRRVVSLIDAVLTPVEEAVDTVMAAIDALSLEAVQAGIDEIVEAAIGRIEALDPTVLLEVPLTSFRELRQGVLDFDPLAPIQAVLEALRDTVARVLGKLSAEKLLEDPVAIYELVVAELGKLDVQALLEPILIQLDEIGLEIHLGLDDTAGAFERLQTALPAPGGGASGSLSVEVG